MFDHIKMYVSCMLIACATASCMELELKKDPAPSDIVLQKLIQQSNSCSLCMVKIFKEHVEQHGKTITSANMGSLLDLDKSAINQLFLENIDDEEMRRFLWSMGPDIEKENYLFYTKNPAALKDLIEWRGYANGVNEKDETPLYFHCAERHKDVSRNEIAHVLLEAGAYLHTPIDKKTGKKRDSLLRLAIFHKDEEFTNLLCEHKADVNEVDYLGTSLLEHAIYSDLVGLVAPLLTHGASADSPNHCHEYPIHKAIRNDTYLGSYGQPKQPVLEIVLLLLESGANPNRPYPETDGKKMPLHRAVALGAVSVVKALLDYKASPDCYDKNGCTPLALAKKLALGCPFDCFRQIIALLIPVTSLEFQEQEKVVVQKSTKNQTAQQSSDDEGSESQSDQYKWIDNMSSKDKYSPDKSGNCSIL